MGKTGSTVTALQVAGLLLASSVLAADEPPERVSDTAYGMALYDYYQGNTFDALVQLNVAVEDGGIEGHGDHPALVEGGLMLAYGMTREARTLFENLLDDADVSVEARNQAWFYLGKVFWLEGDNPAALGALDRANADGLERNNPDLYYEWLYLRAQLAMADTGPQVSEPVEDMIQALPPGSPWRAYLQYNKAVRLLAGQESDEAVSLLSGLASRLQKWPTTEPDIAAEMSALEEQVRLSLGRLHLAQGDFQGAMAGLSAIPLDGVFSDQALFEYAVAASRQENPGLALQALDTLQDRPLFTPWLQQVPYARGFILEQMNRPDNALRAYRTASDHYAELDSQLARDQQLLSESRLVRALSFLRAGESQPAAGASARPLPGEKSIMTDAYGRVQVQPADFSLAALLATEPFQLALRDLHELYRLQDSLAGWQQQLESFEVMLATRRARREARIRETQDSLEALNADQWLALQADYQARIEAASTREDARFFMTQKQQALASRIDEVEARLAVLPDDASTRRQRQAFARMKAYFLWQIEDDYSVNRWAAVSQLKGLDREMQSFISQRQFIEKEMASDDPIRELANRIDEQSNRLRRVSDDLETVLEQNRARLLDQVTHELASQREHVAGYLRASRHAEARLADELFLGVNAAISGSEAGGGDE